MSTVSPQESAESLTEFVSPELFQNFSLLSMVIPEL